MNPIFGRAMGMLKSRATGGTGTVRIGGPGKGGSGGPGGPSVVASAPDMGGGMLERMRSRVRGMSGGANPKTMKRPGTIGT